jgi:hypothetical protein
MAQDPCGYRHIAESHRFSFPLFLSRETGTEHRPGDGLNRGGRRPLSHHAAYQTLRGGDPPDGRPAASPPGNLDRGRGPVQHPGDRDDAVVPAIRPPELPPRNDDVVRRRGLLPGRLRRRPACAVRPERLVAHALEGDPGGGAGHRCGGCAPVLQTREYSPDHQRRRRLDRQRRPLLHPITLRQSLRAVAEFRRIVPSDDQPGDDGSGHQPAFPAADARHRRNACHTRAVPFGASDLREANRHPRHPSAGHVAHAHKF